MFYLATLVQADHNPPPGIVADAAYVFGNTADLERPILRGAAALYNEEEIRRFELCKLAPGYPHNEENPRARYSDFDVWKRWLRDLGVGCVIRSIPSPSPANPGEKFPLSHTGSEAEEFLKLAKVEGWKCVYVVSHPIHILRAFAITVAVAKRMGYDLDIYARAGRMTEDWTDGTARAHNAGENETYFDAMHEEFIRINKVYNNKWDLIPAKELVEYIITRDRRARAMAEAHL
jgi:hypothetical protein